MPEVTQQSDKAGIPTQNLNKAFCYAGNTYNSSLNPKSISTIFCVAEGLAEWKPLSCSREHELVEP